MKAVTSLIPVLLLTGILSAASVHLKKREIRPGNQIPANQTRVEESGPRWMAGRSHLMIQFRHPLNADMVQELNQRGAYVVGALPDSGVMVSVPDDFSVQGLDVDWSGRLEASDKVSTALETPRKAVDGWVLVEFFADVNMREARRLAEAAGFQVHEHRDLIPTHLLLSGSLDRLSGLAQWDEVAYLFPASRALIRGERVHHCAGALTSGGTTPMYVTASSGWSKDATGQVVLSYVLGSIPPKLDSAQANQELLRALNAWTQYAPIKFIAGQIATSPRTVYMTFASKNHGDGYPFDGPGGLLAHTFYPAPPNPESIAGDMHFDADEDWHIGANTDLYTVAVHEAGHALGLAHVDNPNAVMYPYYRLGSKIGPDDVAGIQSLYGTPQGTSAPVTATSSLTLTIAAPAANSTTSASAIAVAGTTAGATGTVRVTWQTDHGGSGMATGTSGWTASNVPLVVGSNTITVTAADASHKTVQTVAITRTPAPIVPPATADRTPPTLSINSPAGTIMTTTAATIDVKGTAFDNVAVSKIAWQSCGGAGTATGTANWTASGIPLLVGDNTIIVRAYDAAGNTSWKSVLVIRN